MISKRTFNGLWIHIKMGIPATLMTFLTLTGIEFFTLLSGYLTIEDMAAHVIVVNLFLLCFWGILGHSASI